MKLRPNFTRIPKVPQLRKSGRCILSRGAIEDYYHESAPKTGSKPERAIAAAQAVASHPVALALSKPLAQVRDPELIEIFSEVFRDMA